MISVVLSVGASCSFPSRAGSLSGLKIIVHHHWLCCCRRLMIWLLIVFFIIYFLICAASLQLLIHLPVAPPVPVCSSASLLIRPSFASAPWACSVAVIFRLGGSWRPPGCGWRRTRPSFSLLPRWRACCVRCQCQALLAAPPDRRHRRHCGRPGVHHLGFVTAVLRQSSLANL